MGGPAQTSLQQHWEFCPSGSWKLSKVSRGQGVKEAGSRACPICRKPAWVQASTEHFKVE